MICVRFHNKKLPVNTSTFTIDTKILGSQSMTAIIAIGVSTVMLSSAFTITVVVLIRNYRRRSAKQELYTDTSYSTLNRGSGLQVQPQSIQQNELYDQIHLSPSTGQIEFISKPQSENINNPTYNSHPTHPHTENSVTSASQTNSPQATYAAIDKSKKKVKKDDTKHTAAEKYTQKVSSTKGAHMEGRSNSTRKSLDDIYYASDHKD